MAGFLARVCEGLRKPSQGEKLNTITGLSLACEGCEGLAAYRWFTGAGGRKICVFFFSLCSTRKPSQPSQHQNKTLKRKHKNTIEGLT